jgi:hypothetical protein
MRSRRARDILLAVGCEHEHHNHSAHAHTAHAIVWRSMSSFCPCPVGGSAANKLVELSPFRDAGSGSDEDTPAQPASLADKAKGWLEMAVKPISTFREARDQAAMHAERVAILKAGATMRLVPDGRGQSPKEVRLALAADGSMLTWSGQGISGVMALSAVRDVKTVVQTGIFSRGGDVPMQWMCVADDQSVRFEASSEEEKLLWMEVVEKCASEQSEAKSGRKLAHQAKRQMGLEARKREAERRKAEVMKTCSSGGMKHTAAAMMSRA